MFKIYIKIDKDKHGASTKNKKKLLAVYGHKWLSLFNRYPFDI